MIAAKVLCQKTEKKRKKNLMIRGITVSYEKSEIYKRARCRISSKIQL